MPSIKDVAKLAGVSYTTVSHVINNTRTVKKETREKVLQAIKDSGYRVNQTARNLKTGKSFTIGIIDANSSDLFFLEVMRAAQTVLDSAGYTLLYSFSEPCVDEECELQDWLAQKELDYLDQFISKDVDAIILNPVNRDEILEEYFTNVNIPTILFQRDLKGPNNYPILSDDYRGGYEAIKHFIELGHRDMCVIYGFSYESHSVHKRICGIKDALKEYSIDFNESNFIDGKYDCETAYNETKKLLQREQTPTAIFYYSDVMAFGGMRAAADCGVKVPEELSIIGYDDIHISRYTVPRLTTIRQDSNELGIYIGTKLLEILKDNTDKSVSLNPFPVTLKLRESTKLILYP